MKRLFLVLFSFCFLLSGCLNRDNQEIIRFSTWGSSSEMAILKPILADFEKENPKIKVQLMHIPQDYFQKLHLLFASKTEPDVLLINNLNIPVYSNFLEDLSQIIDENIYFEKALASMSDDEYLYAIPRDCSGLVVYYNKEIFKKNGVAFPNENWSLEDLKNIAGKLTTKNNFGISYEPQIYYALPFMTYFDGGIIDSSSIKNIGVSVNSKKGINFYKDLVYKYHYAPMPSEVGSKTLAQMFLEGRIAMHISGRWLVPKYRNCANFDWDIVNFPKYSATTDSTGWAISKNSKHKESAIKLVLFMSKKENIEKMTKSGLIVPARCDVAYSKSFLRDKPNNSVQFIKSVKYADITTVNKTYNKQVERLNEVYFNE